MSELPHDTSIQAEYEDGFILDETEQKDVSAYIDCPLVDGVPTGPNTFDDILHKRPEAEHGKMVRFSLFYKDKRHDVDWTTLPDNARPIRFRNLSGDWDPATGNMVNVRLNWLKFGYQFKDENGKNQKEVIEL